jgi:hypothetical protein
MHVHVVEIDLKSLHVPDARRLRPSALAKTTMEGLRTQLSTEGPASSVSSWLSSSLEFSTSTIKSLSSWGSSNDDDDNDAWREVATIPTLPRGTKTNLMKNSGKMEQ